MTGDVKPCLARGTVKSWQDTLTKYSTTQDTVKTGDLTEVRYLKGTGNQQQYVGSLFTMGGLKGVDLKRGDTTVSLDAGLDGRINRCTEENR